jgi:preprotein translocase subunit SecG
MVTFLTVVYVLVATVMVLAILLQSGKGGGLGAALGGGASQTVFGGGGGADVMAKVTQICAAGFMILAMYLAYASAHSGSEFLQENSAEDELAKYQAKEGQEVNYEQISGRSQALPSPEEAAKKRAAAAGMGETVLGATEDKSAEEAAPAPVKAPAPAEAPAPAAEAPAPTGTPAAPADAAPANAEPTEAPAPAAVPAEAPAPAEQPAG